MAGPQGIVGIDAVPAFGRDRQICPMNTKEYILDPTGFMLAQIHARVDTALQPLSQLPMHPGTLYNAIIQSTGSYARPACGARSKRSSKLAKRCRKCAEVHSRLIEDLKDLGFPLRGSRHEPRAVRCGRRLPARLERRDAGFVPKTRPPAEPHGPADDADPARRNLGREGYWRKHDFIPLHWGLDGFMSPKQFTTFFWPQFQKVLLTLIEAGLYPHGLGRETAPRGSM